MTQQDELNRKILEILDALLTRVVGRQRYSEPKHGIEGDPEWDLFMEAFNIIERQGEIQ